jgi:hypothetical protein
MSFAAFYKKSLAYPPVFDLLIVARCARRLCFFLARRASAYLLTACGWADCFSDFAWAFGSLFGSNPSTGVVLIFFSLIGQNATVSIFLRWTSGNRQTDAWERRPSQAGKLFKSERNCLLALRG